MGPRAVANPGYEQDLDASRNSTLDNPLATGKKLVEEKPTSEWGTLRYGVPKADTTFGLPAQSNPDGEADPSQNIGKGPVSYNKGNGGVGNSVM